MIFHEEHGGFGLFNISKNSIQKKLLKSIVTDNSDILKKNYKPKFIKDKKNIEQWEEFKEELKHNNRFFPNNAPNISQLEPFGKYIGKLVKKGDQNFYRSRINKSDKPYEIKDMGKPPKKEVLNGRANPIGIPYLYISSTINTAISEIRGHKGEIVTVAEFEMNSDLKLADLRDPINTISPFDLSDEDELELIYKNMPFLSLLGNELSKPVIPREANLEYLPSQYLCELLKHIGFHGIIYKSSIDTGNNYVIFDDSKLKCINTFQYKITEMIIKSEKI